MTNFDLAGFGIGSICPGNELLYDDVGLPSVMVRVPKMTLSQLGMGDSSAVHPAFIVNGKEVDEIWISKFQNVVHDGRAYSLPARDPTTYITWEDALAACTAKGRGWHLMTRMERGALMRWCESNGFVPNGNNNYGKDTNEASYKAIPTAYTSVNGQTRPSIVATGTGPLSWAHNNEPDGIYDLKGNVNEWTGGIRAVYGEIQILSDNDSADSSNSQAGSSSLWKAIDAATGELVTPDGNGTTAGTLKIAGYQSSTLFIGTEVTGSINGSNGCSLQKIELSDNICDAAKLLLQELGLVLYSDSDLCSGNYGYGNNTRAEVMMLSGGLYSNAAAGIANFEFYQERAYSAYTLSFRSAYVDLP